MQVMLDMLYCFFVLKNYPDNYGPSRLWELPRDEWAFFYGSNYNPFQRSRLRRTVHPYFLEQALVDKEVADGLCSRMGIRVPRTIGLISPTTYSPDLLREYFDRAGADRLIVKPAKGHAGIGVVMASRVGRSIAISSRSGTSAANDYMPTEKCLVQEVVMQHPDLSRISSASLNTVRVLTMLTPSDEFVVLGASMRFGVGGAFVDNWSAGGIAVGLSHQAGTLNAIGYDKIGRGYTKHPDSGIVFDGFPIPLWGDFIQSAERIHRSFPFFRLLGMDLALAVDGVVLIEINNDADLVFQEQTTGPLLKSEHVWRAFKEYGLLYNSAQETLFTESAKSLVSRPSLGNH
jgi:hypothetical protein